MGEPRDSEPRLCPCGFWGSAKTQGLCSKCYNEFKKRSPETVNGTDTNGGQLAGTSHQARGVGGGGRSSKMDSNSRHCPSRSSADNLGKQPATTACASEDQKDSKALPTSCATSSAAEDRTPSPVLEAGGSNNCPPTCGMEEMAKTSSMAEGGSGGALNGKEESVPSTSSQTVSERCKGEGASLQQQKSLELSSAATTGTGGSGGSGAEQHSGGGSEHLTVGEPRVPSPHPSSNTAGNQQPSATGKEVASSEPASQKEKNAATATSSQGTKRSHEEVEKEDGGANPVKQRNKKRCLRCSTKLELAQREIGRCRCGGVFCPTHRHPEAHSCDFDHKEDGRREAREKMVKPTRHLGTSFRREHS